MASNLYTGRPCESQGPRLLCPLGSAELYGSRASLGSPGTTRSVSLALCLPRCLVDVDVDRQGLGPAAIAHAAHRSGT